MEDELRQAVAEVVRRDDVSQAVDALYADVQGAIDERRPKCVVSGRCCNFEEFGHRLYVTTLELAAFVRQFRDNQVESPTQWDGRGCPYQRNKLCTVHAFRPFGCRIYFCDATSTQWQYDQYEQFHDRLKRLHESLEVPYFYVEWRQALAAVGELLANKPSQILSPPAVEF